MVGHILEFEKPIIELENKIAEMREYSAMGNVNMQKELEQLEKKVVTLQKEIYSGLTNWQRVQLARHHNRPYTLDYINRIASEFTEMHGDRFFADDPAIVGGIITVDDKPIVIIGHQKGRDTKSNLYRNFGMANPEGYRKALRLMKLAEKFHRPVVTLIDTPGAFPGRGSEERGISEAIARNLHEMAVLRTQIICIVTGEGGSGGALALGVGDRVLMLENAIYSVISPEGCASILFRDASKAPQASESLKLTARDLKELGLVDDIIPEPMKGAHRDHDGIAHILKEWILREIDQLQAIPIDDLIEERIQKFGRMGYYTE